MIAPVMRPSAGETAPFFRHLLHLNATHLCGAAFGMRDRDVIVAFDRSIAGLDRIEVEEAICRVGEYADFYDDVLTLEFGGARCCDLEPRPAPARPRSGRS